MGSIFKYSQKRIQGAKGGGYAPTETFPKALISSSVGLENYKVTHNFILSKNNSQIWSWKSTLLISKYALLVFNTRTFVLKLNRYSVFGPLDNNYTNRAVAKA